MTLSPRQAAEAKYRSSRQNLLLVICITVVNMVICAIGMDTYFLFSITVPYFGAVFAITSPYMFDLLLWGGVAAVSLTLYFLCWLFSKKHPGWMTAALVLFCLDTVFLVWICLLMEDFSGILDALMHIWILYYLIVGVKNASLLKKHPPEGEAPAVSDPVPAEPVPAPMVNKDPWEK